MAKIFTKLKTKFKLIDENMKEYPLEIEIPSTIKNLDKIKYNKTIEEALLEEFKDELNI